MTLKSRMEVDATTAQRQGTRLLVVEDESPLRRILKMALEGLGYRTTFCSDAREALAVFQARPAEFDVVLTDFWMPGLNGVELATQMLAIRKLPILLLSAYCEDWTRERVKSVGLHDLLHKPITIESLDQAILAAIERK